MRSSPANASVIWVPMLDICTSGAHEQAGEHDEHEDVADGHPAGQHFPRAHDHQTTPTMPKIKVARLVIIETPIIDLATLRGADGRRRRRSCSSRFSEV